MLPPQHLSVLDFGHYLMRAGSPVECLQNPRASEVQIDKRASARA